MNSVECRRKLLRNDYMISLLLKKSAYAANDPH